MRNDIFIAVVRMRIRKERLERNLTQEVVAEGTSLPLRSYQRYEAQHDKRPFSPSLRNMREVALAIGVDLAELVTEPTQEEIEALEVDAPPQRVKRSKRR